MPIYEYHCSACEARFDVLQKRTDPAVSVCEACQVEGSVRRLVSAPAAILKGSGFYETEYGRAKHNHPDKAKSDASGGSPKKAESSGSGGGCGATGAAKAGGCGQGACKAAPG